MRKSRFNESQIIGVLREHEAGSSTEEVCRRDQPADFLSKEGEVRRHGCVCGPSGSCHTSHDGARVLPTAGLREALSALPMEPRFRRRHPLFGHSWSWCLLPAK
jgi:hypothetical protein